MCQDLWTFIPLKGIENKFVDDLHAIHKLTNFLRVAREGVDSESKTQSNLSEFQQLSPKSVCIHESYSCKMNLERVILCIVDSAVFQYFSFGYQLSLRPGGLNDSSSHKEIKSAQNLKKIIAIFSKLVNVLIS